MDGGRNFSLYAETVKVICAELAGVSRTLPLPVDFTVISSQIRALYRQREKKKSFRLFPKLTRNRTRHRAYGFSPMFVTCLHSNLLVVPTLVSFPVHALGNPLRRLTTAAPPRNQLPYPSHPRPTPYQIFHLPRGASQKQVKDRCEFSEARLRLLAFQILTFSSVVLRKITNSFGSTTQIPSTAEPRTFRSGHETRGSAR